MISNTLIRNTAVVFIVAIALAGYLWIDAHNTVEACTQEEAVSEDVAVSTLSFVGENNTCHQLSDLAAASELTIVNAWASWCPFCVEELPDFARLNEEFGDAITIIAINRGESREQAEQFLRETGVSGDIRVLFDPKDRFYRAINGFSMPETIFLSPKGEVLLHKRGVMELEEMRRIVTDLRADISAGGQHEGDAMERTCLASADGVCRIEAI